MGRRYDNLISLLLSEYIKLDVNSRLDKVMVILHILVKPNAGIPLRIKVLLDEVTTD